MEEALVSIIVPVYKVERYLNRAVDSLLGQTYSNLEVILVDDGSPDRCPDICNEYARIDKRVKVIHQHNAGVSASRNEALKIASGSYLTFVDSDDYLSKDAIKKLVECLESAEADVVCCGANLVDDHEIIYDSFKTDTAIEESGITTAKRMLRDVYPFNFSWGKLFKRELFDGIAYPIGRIYEDNATTYRAVAKAQKVICIPDCLYYYFRGRQGNTTSELQSEKAAWSYYCGCLNCEEFLKFCDNESFKDTLPYIHLQLYKWSKLCIESAIRMGYSSYLDYCDKVQAILKRTMINVPSRLKIILYLRTPYYYLYPLIGRNK